MLKAFDFTEHVTCIALILFGLPKGIEILEIATLYTLRNGSEKLLRLLSLIDEN